MPWFGRAFCCAIGTHECSLVRVRVVVCSHGDVPNKGECVVQARHAATGLGD